MSKRKCYDLAIGLGEACSATETLREAGLQHLSFPFDWIVHSDPESTFAKHDVVHRARTLAGRFKDWLKVEDFRFLASTPQNHKDVYVNDAIGMIFNHDFPMGVPLREAFPAIKAKYERRAKRLVEILEQSHKVLLFRLERPTDKLLKPVPTEIDDCREARRILAEAYPHATFDFVLLAFERGRDERELIEEEIETGLTRIAFDYHNYAPGYLEYAVRVDRTGALLKQRFRVHDYRTWEERLKRLLKPLRKLINLR